MRIVIIGGGVCGLSIGWFLARAGQSVTICEASQAGRGATWAAAGMLAPQIEAKPGSENLFPLLRDSLHHWPDFAAELYDVSGLDIGYRDEGCLVVARDRDSQEALRFHQAYHDQQGITLQWLSGPEVRSREPLLHGTVSAGLFSPDDHQVDNRRLAQALIIAFQRAGGLLKQDCPVDRMIWKNQRVSGVACRNGDTIPADQVIVAAGAWSRRIKGFPSSINLPIRPVKGQMVALKMDADAPLIRHNIWYRGIYLVPRRDGRLLVGATVEEMGFDDHVTAGSVYHLLKRAHEILPSTAELPLIETWAGLRPASRDNMPILGPVPCEDAHQNSDSGLIIATGHYRNGILLAPATAAYIADYCLSGRLNPAIATYGPERFSKKTSPQETAKMTKTTTAGH